MIQVIETQLYTGAYTGDQPGEGVRCWRFDGAALQETGKYGGLRNPSYVLPVGKRLYAVEELPDRAGAACFSLDGNGGLSVLWQKEVPGAGLCHAAVAGDSLYVSGYAGGTLTAVDAATGRPAFYREFQGSGPNVLRQEKAHIHSSLTSPDGSRLLVADLGSDRLYQFVRDSQGSLRPDEAQPWFQIGPGQGPRHFAFHPNGKWLYLVTELDRSLLVFRYEANSLQFVKEYSLRESRDPENSLAADIHVTPDGRFLYVSVRGPGCLCGFQIQGDGGELVPIGRFPAGGVCPRSFHISADGRFVAVANQEPGTLVIFPRKEESGLLGSALCSADVPDVSCVKWEDCPF